MEQRQIIDGLIYTLSQPTDCGGENIEEINVTMWAGSRKQQARNFGAQYVLDCINQRDDLLAQLKELRRWVGDGDMSDDNCIDNYYSPAYKAMIEQTDAVIAKEE
jgi:hypothetical protein